MKYDYDFKISVVEAYKNGLTYKEIRGKFHVTKTCFYDWQKLYNTKVHQKEKTFTKKEPNRYESDSIKWFSKHLPLFSRAVDIFADLCDDSLLRDTHRYRTGDFITGIIG